MKSVLVLLLALAVMALLTRCTQPRLYADMCDVPSILPQVQGPPLTLEHWRSACVIIGVKSRTS